MALFSESPSSIGPGSQVPLVPFPQLSVQFPQVPYVPFPQLSVQFPQVPSVQFPQVPSVQFPQVVPFPHPSVQFPKVPLFPQLPKGKAMETEKSAKNTAADTVTNFIFEDVDSWGFCP